MLRCIEDLKCELGDNFNPILARIKSGGVLFDITDNPLRDKDIFCRLFENETVKSVASSYNISNDRCSVIVERYCNSVFWYHPHLLKVNDSNVLPYIPVRFFYSLRRIGVHTIYDFKDYIITNKSLNNIQGLGAVGKARLKLMLNYV